MAAWVTGAGTIVAASIAARGAFASVGRDATCPCAVADLALTPRPHRHPVHLPAADSQEGEQEQEEEEE